MKIAETPQPKLKIVPPDPAEAVRFLTTQIAEAKASQQELERAYREQRRALDRHIARLEKARHSMREKRQRVRVRRGHQLDPRAQAGPKNVTKGIAFFRKRRVATQAAMSAATGIGSGASTWTIKALVEDGVIEETGERIDRSKQYRYLGMAGKVTRIEPGQ